MNNLIRIIERGCPQLLMRWHDEQQPSSTLAHACATDWLVQVVLLPHAEQETALAERIQLFDAMRSPRC